MALVDDVFSFFQSRRRHTSLHGDWSSDVCSSDPQPSLMITRSSPPYASREGSCPQKRGERRLASGFPGKLPEARHKPCPQIGRASCRERVWVNEDDVIK